MTPLGEGRLDLALFGSPPRFSEPLHVGLPNVPRREPFFERAADCLRRRRLTNDGPFVRELEERLADRLRVRHCVAVVNGTAALSLAIRAADLAGEVILPSFTFIATAHALRWHGIRPVFAEIDPDTHNIDPARVDELVTARTTGILGVHLWGRPCATEALEEIAASRGLTVMFDAAHAFLCSRGGRMIGGFGAAEAFSFHATKFFHTLEGGAVATNDDAFAARVRRMRDFGYDEKDEITECGVNAKMHEISAAMGLALLEETDEIVEANRRTYRAYIEELDGLSGIRLVRFDEAERNNFQFAVVEIDEQVTGIGRDEIVSVLAAENVLARAYFDPGCHRSEPYRSEDPTAGARLGETERLSGRVLALPAGRAVDRAAVSGVGALLRAAVRNGPAVSRALAALQPSARSRPRC